ncbi:hypothetical protein OC846_004925 [Tilletia horrida]|uniref:J domain-containing protein n=1 Tax=Tilletia horrida TaxID=155126 RepID=A0AAN6GNX4_9BASI|nr:hypothetical protein OC846_004925 [Tilletia horrida]KAK0563748.1 hypothetical protein OC861_004647 [Tilletia horrida]
MDIAKGDLDSQTAYQILGLTPAATLAEIRAAYLTLARQYHPDKQKQTSTEAGSKAGEDDAGASSSSQSPVIVRLNEAYSALATSESRATYDAQLLADHTSSTQDKQQESSTARISAVVDLNDFEVKHIDDLDGIPPELRDKLARAGTSGATLEQLHKLDSIHPITKGSTSDDDQHHHRSIPQLNINNADKQSHPGKEDGEDEDEDDAESSSQVLFVYPCRCGQFFIVHPDELITEAVISDTLADMDQLTLEQQRLQQHASLGGNASDTGSDSAPNEISILSTCSGCSQVIKVIWGHDDDDDTDSDGQSDSDS